MSLQRPITQLRSIFQRLDPLAPTHLNPFERLKLLDEARAISRHDPQLETLCVTLLGSEWSDGPHESFDRSSADVLASPLQHTLEQVESRSSTPHDDFKETYERKSSDSQ